MQKFLINKTVLLIFFIFSFLFLILASKASAANGSLYLSPSSGVYTVNNTFSVAVAVNTDGVSINAAQGTLVFSPDKLSVVGISKGGSVFSLWTAEPTYSNSLGTISFGGGIPNPGYTGSAGNIITITFKAKVSGTAAINWSSGAVLANDGKGTNILTSMGGGNYTLGAAVVTPPAEPVAPSPQVPAKPGITSSTHPDESKWYSNSTVKFSWVLPADVTGVSILFDQKPTSNPGSVSDGLFDSKTYENTGDGIWYLHLKLRNKYGWGAITHFKVQVDTTAPRSFEIEVKEGVKTDNPQPTLIFKAKDDTSGIDYYEVKIDGQDPLKVTPEEISVNPFKMPFQPPGKHTVVIETFDRAGNSTAATTEVDVLPIETPKLIDYPSRLDLGDILTITGTALPDVIIKCYIEKEGREFQAGETKSNENGEWTYVHDRSLPKGVYEVYVRAVDSRGAQSYASEKFTVIVSLPILLKIGSIVIDYITVIIVLLIAIGLTIFIIYWGWHKFKRFRKRLRKETEEVENALHKAFDLLKEEIDEELRKLEKIKGMRKLSREEEKIEEQLKKDLDIAEQYIKKEIKDVEKELK